MRNHGQSLIKGSLILLLANLLVKIIGAAFKIPLANLLGNEGMGYFNAAYSIYSGLFVIATAGLPVAVSKMVSGASSLSNYKEVKRIFSIAYIIFLVIGLSGSCVLFFGADSLAATTKYLDSNIAIKAIAPAILFVSLMSVYRGFFQGMSDMLPTAVSEVVEAFAKLVIGFAAAYFLISKGLPVASAGAISGVTLGTLLSFIILMAIHFARKKHIYENIALSPQPRSYKSLIGELVKIAVPVTISASVFTLTNMIDYIMIGRNLTKIAEFLHDTPVALYGMYTGKAVVLYNFPPTLVMSLCMALVPAISRSFAAGDRDTVRITTTQSLRTTVLFSVPCCVGLGVLATPILNLLFGTNDAATLLTLISPAVLFVSLVLVSNAILQATGHVNIPVINIAFGGIAKVIVNNLLVSNPAININGAPIGTDLCYFIYMLLNLIYVCKITKAEINFAFWAKPIISGIVMAAAAFFVYGLVAPLAVSKIGIIIALAISGGISVICYLLTLLAIGGITRKDIKILPKGDLIAGILTKMKLMK